MAPLQHPRLSRLHPPPPPPPPPRCRDMRSQQLLSRLIARMRAVPQPIIAAVQVWVGRCVPGQD